MGDFLHRITKQHLISTSPNDLLEPIGKYISNPDLSAVAGFPSRYWVITGDVISLMSQAEQDVVDAAVESARRDAQIAGEVDRLESVLRQIVKLVVNELNILRQQFNTTTGESQQLTDTNLADRTLAQVRNQLRSGLGT